MKNSLPRLFCRPMATFLAVAAACSCSLPALAEDPPIGVNLIVNPGAELGTSSVNGQWSVPIPGWTPSGNFTVASYVNTAGLPSLASPGSPTRGLNFFVGGPTNQTATIQQVIDLHLLTDLIDASRAEFDLSGWLGGSGNQDDSALLIAVFNDANGDSLSTATIAGPTSAVRGNQSGMLFRSRQGVIPVGSRSVNVIVLASRSVAPFNDGCADDLSLVVTEGYCPADWDQDQDVDSDDVIVFFSDWEAGNADTDGDEDADSDDIVHFFNRWDSGC